MARDTVAAGTFEDAPPWCGEAGGENPYLGGSFAPVAREIDASDLPVEGEIPRDLDGVLLRNGPNPAFAPKGRYHWFDGDGMVHAVEFRAGRARYCNRYIQTPSLRADRDAGAALWTGLGERPNPKGPLGSGSDGFLKDTANTDLVFHNGRVLTLWYQCGIPYALDARTLETIGPETFDGALPRLVSAHAKVDERTGELFFFGECGQRNDRNSDRRIERRDTDHEVFAARE